MKSSREEKESGSTLLFLISRTVTFFQFSPFSGSKECTLAKLSRNTFLLVLKAQKSSEITLAEAREEGEGDGRRRRCTIVWQEFALS